MNLHISRHKKPAHYILLLLNVIALCFYFILLHKTGMIQGLAENVFSSSDAQEYLGYTQFLEGSSPYCNPNRPFFYPLLLLAAKSAGGPTGIWIMQMLLWLAACNLSFFSVMYMRGSIFWSSMAFLLPATYFSAIILTTHALSETLLLFLLSALTYVFSRYAARYLQLRFGLTVIALLSLLFVTKPLFELPLYIGLLLFIIALGKKLVKKPVLLLWLLLCLSPALVQYGINKTYQGVFKSETIFEYNLRHYLANKVDYYEETHDLESFDYLGDSIYALRRQKMDKLSLAEIKSLLLAHPVSTGIVMYDNLKLNIGAPHPYIGDNPALRDRSWHINQNFFRLHRFMFFAFIIYTLAAVFTKKTWEHIYFLGLGFILFMLLLSNGITFWAGDRLAVPTIGIWCVLYPMLICTGCRLLVTKPGAILHKPYRHAWQWLTQKVKKP